MMNVAQKAKFSTIEFGVKARDGKKDENRARLDFIFIVFVSDTGSGLNGLTC